MNPIQVLLEELNKRITLTTSLITDLKQKKNAVLAIENILFKYKITDKIITPEHILKMEAEDLFQILTEIGKEDVEELTDEINKNCEIIRLYRKITSSHELETEPPQYTNAKASIEKVIREISEYLSNYEKEQKDHIKSIEAVLKSNRDIQSKFKGYELTTPIFDMVTFHDMLNKCGLDLTTKAAIKKEVGKLNFNLVTNKGVSKTSDEKLLDKYRVILERKKQEYGDELKEVQEIFLKKKRPISIDNTLTRIDELFGELDKPYRLVQNAIVSIMIEREISNYDKLLNDDKITDAIREAAVVHCELLLVISRKKPPKQIDDLQSKEETKTKEEPKEKTEDQEVKHNEEDLKIIAEIEKIVSEELSLLKEYSDNDTTRLTEISNLHEKYALEEESQEKTTLTIAFLAETLRLNLIFFKQLIINYKSAPKEYETDYKKMVGDLRDYLSTYYIVKKRSDQYQNSTKKK